MRRLMMKRLTIASLVLLAGCSLTPKEVLDQGERTTFNSPQPPAAAARCLARNAENIAGHVTARERTEANGTVEVTVRSNAETSSILAIATAAPAGTGSLVTITISPQALGPGMLKSRLPAGC